MLEWLMPPFPFSPCTQWCSGGSMDFEIRHRILNLELPPVGDLWKLLHLSETHLSSVKQPLIYKTGLRGIYLVACGDFIQVPHNIWQIVIAHYRDPLCIPSCRALSASVSPLPWDFLPSLDEGVPCTPKVLHLLWSMLLTWYVPFSVSHSSILNIFLYKCI